MKIVWCTDIHLDFVDLCKQTAFCHKINLLRPDIVLVGGDISVSTILIKTLLMLEKEIHCPVFFVLGNHDYYHGSISNVRKRVIRTSDASSNLQYLANTDIIELTTDTCLIGHDSWSDGRYGDYLNSDVMLNDYRMIEEFRGLDKHSRFKKLNELGDEAAVFFREKLSEALLNYQHILILTHVPPFPESCWHEGHLSDNDFLPHFSCKATGDVFIEVMSKYPDKNMTVLCGHTHSAGIAQIAPNISVRTGGAVYRKPGIQDPIFIKE